MEQHETAQEWLKRAKSNLNRSKESDHLELREIVIEDLLFDAQQSAEKSFKAVLINYDIKFPMTHDLAKLITLLQNNNVNFPEEILEAAELTTYAVITRYPGNIRKIEKEDLNWAVDIAEKVYNWAKNIIETKR